MLKNRIRYFLRATAIVTLVAYLPTNFDFSYAASSAIPLEVNIPSSVQIEQNLALGLPAELGRMDSFRPGHKGTILHIQTAHGHYEAQEKIEKLLEWLSGKFGSFPILLEGAADQLEPSRLEFFPNQPEANLLNARWLAKKSLVTGPELFLLKNKNAQGVGIESESAYRANHGQFVRVLKSKKEAEYFFDLFKREMEKAASVFSFELRAFLKRLEQCALGIVPLDVWLPELQRAVLKHLDLDLNDTAWQVRWPMMVRFFKIQSLSKEFDAAKYEAEKGMFLEQIQKHGGLDPRASGLFNRIELLLSSTGRSVQLPEPETENVFIEMLRFLPEDFDFEPYQQVGKWIALLVLQSQIDFGGLADEISRLEDLIAVKLARNENEKNILDIFSDYRMLEKLLALQLTPLDFEKIQNRLESESEILPSGIAARLKLSAEHLPELDHVFREAVAFYQGAKLRDDVMIQRAEQYFKKHSASFAVLVTGGFHSKPMREHFEKAGYAYGVVTPAIKGLDEAGYQAYLKAMLAGGAASKAAPNHMIELALGSNPLLGSETRQQQLLLTVRQIRAKKELEGWRTERAAVSGNAKVDAALLPAEAVSYPIQIAQLRSPSESATAELALSRSEAREAVLKRDGIFEIIESPDLRLRLKISEFLFGSTRWGQVTTGTVRFQIEQFQDERWVALVPIDENQQEIIISAPDGSQRAVVNLPLSGKWQEFPRSFQVLVENQSQMPFRIYENEKGAVRQHVVSLSNIQENAANSSIAVSGNKFEVSKILADAIEVVSGRVNRSEADPDAKPNDYDFAFRQLSDYRDQFSAANDFIGDVRRWEQSEDNIQRLMSRVVSQAIGRFQRSEARQRVPVIGQGLSGEEELKAFMQPKFVRDDPNSDLFAELLGQNQVLYLSPTPPVSGSMDYDGYHNKLDGLAMALGHALRKQRDSGDRQRKVIVLRGLFSPGTTAQIYSTIKWNAKPVQGEDLNFEVVFQPDFALPDANGEYQESALVFGQLNHVEDAQINREKRDETQVVLRKLYPDKEIDFIDDSSAELSKEIQLIYLGAKLAHFDDIAELSRRYGADLSVAALGAGLDKRIRTLFANPSLGFGSRLFNYLRWIRAVRLFDAAASWEGSQTFSGNETEKHAAKIKAIEAILSDAASQVESGENQAEVIRKLPRSLHMLFLIDTILRVNKQNIIDFYELVSREYQQSSGPLRGKKVTLLSIGDKAQSNLVSASPALILIDRLIHDEDVSEFYVADEGARELFQLWVNEKRKTDSKYRAVRFHGMEEDDEPYTLANGKFYEAVEQGDLTIIATDSNADLKAMDLSRLAGSLKSKTLFDGMNLFGLRADGTHQYQLEAVRDKGINLVSVGRINMGPRFDDSGRTSYRLSDSSYLNVNLAEPDKALAEYDAMITDRGGDLNFDPMNVAIVGGGYVGLTTAANLARWHKVHVVDIPAKEREMRALQSDETKMPIFEPGLEEMVVEGKQKGHLQFSIDKETAIGNASVVYLAVGTPSQDNGDVDLTYILKATRDIGEVILKNRGKPKTIVVKSTVPPHTFEEMDRVLRELGLNLGVDYALVSNPEFLKEGDAVKDVTEPDRTVLGFYSAMNPEQRKQFEVVLLKLWRPLMQSYPHQVLLTDTASSTIIKYLANSMLAISITLSNLFAEEVDHLGADFSKVRNSLFQDPRIGKNAFLWPGCGYGGSCFPKDVEGLAFSSLEQAGHTLPMIDIATIFNDFFKYDAVRRALELAVENPKAGTPLAGKKVVMLGMAFKANTDDMREASSVSILYELLNRGAEQVRLHDPIFTTPGAPPKDIVIDHFLDYLFKEFQGDSKFAAVLKVFLSSKKTTTDESIPAALRAELVSPNRNDKLLASRFFKEVYFKNNFIETGRVVFDTGIESVGQADLVMLVTEWPQYRTVDLTVMKKPGKRLAVFDGRNLLYPRIQEIVGQGIDYAGIGTRGAVLEAQRNLARRSEARVPNAEEAVVVNQVIRHFAERAEQLPQKGILAVLGNPTPDYPQQVVDLIRQANPQAIMIVGNGAWKDGAQQSEPEYERLRREILKFGRSIVGLDQMIFIETKDLSMNTGENVGVVAEIMARKKAWFDLRGIATDKVILTQMPAGMRLSRRIFEYQWRRNADAKGIGEISPKFIPYAADQPIVVAGEPISKEAEDILRFAVLGPNSDGKGQMWRFNEWHQGDKPNIAYHAEDHLDSVVIQTVEDFLNRSEARVWDELEHESQVSNPVQIFKSALELERKNNSGILLNKLFGGLVGFVVGGVLFAALGLGGVAIVGAGIGAIAGFFGIALVFGDVLSTDYFDALEKLIDQPWSQERILLLQARKIEIETGAYHSLVASPLRQGAIDAIKYALSRSEEQTPSEKNSALATTQQIEEKLAEAERDVFAQKKSEALQAAIRLFTLHYDLLDANRAEPQIENLPENLQRAFLKIYGRSEKFILSGKMGGTTIGWALASRWGVMSWRQEEPTHVDQQGRKLVGKPRAEIEAIEGSANRLEDIVGRITRPMAEYWNRSLDVDGEVYLFKDLIRGYVLSAPGWFDDQGRLTANQSNIAHMNRNYHFDDPKNELSISAQLLSKHGILLSGRTLHDGTAHAMGEMSHLYGTGARNFVYLGPGSGMAHRVMIAGEPFTGGEEIAYIQNELPNYMFLQDRTEGGVTSWKIDWDLGLRISAGERLSSDLSVRTWENQTAGVAKVRRLKEALSSEGLLVSKTETNFIGYVIKHYPEIYKQVNDQMLREMGHGIVALIVQSKEKFGDRYPDYRAGDFLAVLGGKITTSADLELVKNGAKEVADQFGFTAQDIDRIFVLSAIPDDVREFLAAVSIFDQIGIARSEQRLQPAGSEVSTATQTTDYRSSLETARAKLLVWLGGIVPQRWLSVLGFKDAVIQVQLLTGSSAFAEEVPMSRSSVLDADYTGQTYIANPETVRSSAKIILDQQFMEELLNAENALGLFALLQHATGLIVFDTEGNLLQRITDKLSNRRSGLSVQQKQSALESLKALRIVSGQAETVYSEISTLAQKPGTAVLLASATALEKVRGELVMALREAIHAGDAQALVALIRVLKQAAVLDSQAAESYLQRQIDGLRRQGRGWLADSIQTLISSLIANHELVAVSA